MTTSRRFQVRQASQDWVRAVCAAAKPAGGGGHRADESVLAEGAQPAVRQDGGTRGLSLGRGERRRDRGGKKIKNDRRYLSEGHAL